VRLFRFRAGQEFRTLVHHTPAGPGYYSHVRPAAGGRLLAIQASKGIALVDLIRGEEVALLRLPPSNFPLRFEPAGAALLTYGANGLLRWPIGAEPATPGSRRVGPPQRLHASTTGDAWGSTPDGQVIAIPDFYRGAIVLHRDENRTLRLGPQDDVRSCAVSPDGRWVATGTHWYRDGAGAKVWDAQSGRHVKDLPVGAGGVGFSPDGRWLVTSSGGVRLWRVGTWQEGPALGGPATNGSFAFTPDGRLLALGDVPGVVRLVRPDTGKELARLTAPEETRLNPQCFTPDGTQLVTLGSETQALHLVDLRALRAQLAPLGLDWDAPPYPPVPDGTGGSLPPPIQMEVIGADLATDPEKRQQYERARTLVALWANPFDAQGHFQLGTRLLQDGKPEPAYQHFSFALALRPGMVGGQQQRAVAAFRLGRWAEAAADATAVLRHQPDDPDTLTLRGRASQKLGRHAEAVADFTAALARYPRSFQLHELLAASSAALGQKAAAAADREQARELARGQSKDLNNLAWRLVTGPAGERDPARALPLISQAVNREPQNPTYLNTLGVVQYRLGRYREAAATLEKSLAAGKGEHDAFDLFFLAMCHHHLGDAARARDCYDRALKWRHGHKGLAAEHAEELKAFQAEAEALLRRSDP
jgi:tetratricopeptide (TPR) repeat protein